MEYISQDYNGLTKTIAELIAGIEVPANTNGFGEEKVWHEMYYYCQIGLYINEVNHYNTPNSASYRRIQKRHFAPICKVPLETAFYSTSVK